MDLIILNPKEEAALRELLDSTFQLPEDLKGLQTVLNNKWAIMQN